MKSIVKNKENLYLIFILILASALRFYDAFNIPFTHDEFSALFRLNFESFSELIEKGVKIDAHPAGVQVFIYYWIKLFGASSFSVKFPFILMGIASIYFLWLLAQKWFNTTVAIIVTLLLSTLEFPLMHGQIARPYVSGMFLSLWMVYHWQAYLFDSKSKWNKHWILYVLLSSLAAYNHHFSLLFAAIVGVSGMLFIDKNRLIAYVAAGLLIFALYIPHLPIFFYQLSIGGIGGSEGWLGVPESDFLWQFIRYAFNFSWTLLTLVLIVFILSYYQALKNKEGEFKLVSILFAWFILPFLIAYYYSIYLNPIIQYSLLLFTFPFLLLFLFAFVKDVSEKYRVLLILLFLPILSFTTIYERQYYHLFYHSSYKEIVDESIMFQDDKKENVLSVFDSPRKISDHYLDNNISDIAPVYVNDIEDRSSFIGLINNEEIWSVSYGMDAQADAVIPFILYDHFPVVEKRIDYNQGNFYIFSKEGHAEIGRGEKMYRNVLFHNNFEVEVDYWKYDSDKCIPCDSLSEEKCYEFKKGQEWGVSFEIPFDSLVYEKNDLIDISFDVLSYQEKDELLIVTELYSGEEDIDWRSTRCSDFKTDTLRKAFRVYHSIKLSDIVIPKKGVYLKVYAWNKGKTQIKIDDFSIKLRIGNPVLYGLLDKIE